MSSRLPFPPTAHPSSSSSSGHNHSSPKSQHHPYPHPRPSSHDHAHAHNHTACPSSSTTAFGSTSPLAQGSHLPVLRNGYDSELNNGSASHGYGTRSGPGYSTMIPLGSPSHPSYRGTSPSDSGYAHTPHQYCQHQPFTSTAPPVSPSALTGSTSADHGFNFNHVPVPLPGSSSPSHVHAGSRTTPALTYSKTSGSPSLSLSTSAFAGPSGSGGSAGGSSPLVVSAMGSTPKARLRGKSVGKLNKEVEAGRDQGGDRDKDMLYAIQVEKQSAGVGHAEGRMRMRTRTRTITGKSTSSREDHPMGSMTDLETDVNMEEVTVGETGDIRGPDGKASGSSMTLGRGKIVSGSHGHSKAPLSTSSSGSTSSKKHHDPSREKEQEQDRDRDRDSAYGRVRSGSGVPSSALTISNSVEANADGARLAGSPTVAGTNGRDREKEKAKGVVTRSAAKGKGRDYGDRFIPQRDSSDQASSYRLMPDRVAYGTGAGSGGIFGGDAVYLAGHNKISAGGSLRRGMGDERDDLKDDANRAYGQVLQSELYGSALTTDRPRPMHSISAPIQPSRPAHSGLAPVTIVQGQYVPSANALPPLPAHAPTTPTSAASSIFATTARGGSGSTLNMGASRMYQPGYLPPNAPAIAPPTTPSRKRMFNFQSPQSPGRSSPGGSTSAAVVSPGGFGLGQGIGTGAGVGLDDMLNEKYSRSPIGKESQRLLMSPRKTVRFISKTPFKVLDAPDLADDFYLNLVSWSNSNILGVGLSTCVYLWSAHTSKVTKLCDMGSGETRPSTEAADTVTGLEWTNRGSTIAIGTNKGSVEIWDTERCKKIRTMTGHTGRVGALAWNDHILSTGSRDRIIFHRDVRAPSQHIRELKGHRQEVCGLRWNTMTDQLASGGNDNKLYIWDKTNDVPLYKFSEHCAAVKAITWSPHQRGLLASGGGTADKKIRFWNALTGTMLSEWDTGSQVCNLMWSKNSNELVSTHGYSGGAISNQICVWRYPSMSQVATLSGHTYRVLYLAMSPDGQTIVTGAGDETLRFWNAFQKRRTGEAEAIGMSDGVVGQMEIKDESVLNPFSRIR